MTAIELLKKADRTHEESERLVSELSEVLKKASLLVAYYHTQGFKVLRSRSSDELKLYIDLQESIGRLS